MGSTKGLRGRLRSLWRGVRAARRGVEVVKYPHTLAPSLIYTGLISVVGDDELFDGDRVREEELRRLIAGGGR